MTDRELIQLITEYAYLKRRLERVTSKLKEELEKRERDAKIIENIKSI
mgnify:FL=1|jgi:hypothetical protein